MLLIDEFGSEWLLVWPTPGTEWDSNAQAVRFDDEAFSMGQSVSIGGGEAQVDTAALSAGELLSRPADACLPADAWYVHSIARVT